MLHALVSKYPYGVKASDNSTAFTVLDALYNQIDCSTAAKSLALDSIGIFTEEGKLLIGTAANLVDVKSVRFAQGRGSLKQPYLTELIDRKSVTNIEYQAYVAPVKQVWFIGAEVASSSNPVGALNLGAGSSLVPNGADTDGYSAIVTIELVNNEYTNLPFGLKQKQYEIPVPYWITTDDTVYTAEYVKDWVCDQIIAKINADPLSIVVAAGVDAGSGSYAGVSLTAKDYDRVFTVAVNGFLAYANIVTPAYEISKSVVSPTSKNCKLAQGSPAQAIALVKRAWVESGWADRAELQDYQTWKETTGIVDDPGYGYSMYSINYTINHPRIGEMLSGADQQCQLKILVEGTLGGGIPTGSYTISNSSDLFTKLDVSLPDIFGLGVYTAASGYEPGTDYA